LDPEVVDGGAEEHRSLAPGAIGAEVEARGGALHQLDLLAEGTRLLAEELLGGGARQVLDGAVLADAAALARGVHVDAILAEMVDAAQLASHADRPGERRGGDAEHALDLVEQLDGRTPVAVELVDEGHD